MADDDFGIVVGGDDGSGAGSGMIQGTEAVGEGSVVLLKLGAVGGIGRDRDPRTILGERVLRTDETRGCDTPIGKRHNRYEHDNEQTDRESAYRAQQ
jgi:hypothetical protein